MPFVAVQTKRVFSARHDSRIDPPTREHKLQSQSQLHDLCRVFFIVRYYCSLVIDEYFDSCFRTSHNIH
eukprot:g66058.t1